ncbi:MAG TPA: endonuclease III [Candidatus Binatia bacterium]|nr:endonuclease III [Candidatus Binatia bacterium]
MCAISTLATSESTETRVGALLERLKAAYPDAACALRHENPFQLLVATILSAQCTDERVNKVTPALFARFPDAASMKDADVLEMEDLIRTTGFYHNKTKSLLGASRRIVEAYGGTVPSSMEDLLTLPGVARKTANVVLGVGYGIAAGVVVDTHVYRLAHRLGLTRGDTPVQVEQDLMRILPRSEWILFAHLLILHGRRICIARKPRCGLCPVQSLCPSAPFFLRGGVPPSERAGSAPKKRIANVAKKRVAKAKATKKRAGKKRPAKKAKRR